MALQGNVNDVTPLSGTVAMIPAGYGTGSTTDHSQLSNRDAADQHPIEAITGLKEILDKVETSPGGNADQSGLTAEQISALDGMFKICAYTADATDAYKAFQNAFGIGGEGAEDGTKWTDGVPYEYELVANEYSSASGIRKADGWSRTPYLPCKGASSLSVTHIDGTTNLLNSAYGGWYDADKKFIKNFNQTNYNSIDVDADACYAVFSQENKIMANIANITPHA